MFIKEDSQTPINSNDKAIIASKQLQDFIRRNIPLTDFMSFTVDDLTNYSISLKAPLKPNDNHYKTAFGGSIATLGILAGWALLHSKMVEENITGVLVIQQSSTKYLAPARDDFFAQCNDLDLKRWIQFKKDMAEIGKAKITLNTSLVSANKKIAEQESIFVALSRAR